MNVKILIIPDIHLKPWIFDRAEEILKNKKADMAVCLMDIADDFGQMYNVDLYIQTYDRAIQFAKDFSDTKWCYGNHDLSYIWLLQESGFSHIAKWTVNEKMNALEKAVGENGDEIRYVWKLGNILFSHGGVSQVFADFHFRKQEQEDVDYIVYEINKMGEEDIWNNYSPIWFRPQNSTLPMFKSGEIFQVIGHTPEKLITKTGDYLSTDVFSLDTKRKPYGEQAFAIIDTETLDYEKVR